MANNAPSELTSGHPFPVLADAELARIRRFGSRRPTAPGRCRR
jgi:hypothetical protein